MSYNKHIEKFMSTFPFEGLTFDVVSLITQYADFLPAETDITTRLTTNIKLNIPFLSAAMDTVTEADMAIAMALHGGIGVIHKNLDPERQAFPQLRHMRLAKRSLEAPVEYQYHMLPPLKVGQTHRLTVEIGQFKIGGGLMKLYFSHLLISFSFVISSF